MHFCSDSHIQNRQIYRWPNSCSSIWPFIHVISIPYFLKTHEVKGTVRCLQSRLSFKVHVILLDPKKITQFIVDVTNAHDKECLADITKVSITGKAILTKSELESVRNLTWLFTARNNSVYGFCVHILRKHYYIYIQINLNGFVNNALSL